MLFIFLMTTLVSGRHDYNFCYVLIIFYLLWILFMLLKVTHILHQVCYLKQS